MNEIETAVRELIDTPEPVGNSLEGVHGHIYQIVNEAARTNTQSGVRQ